MLRKIIQINQEKCNGCGACVNACHEGAIAMVNGKAKLIRDDYCDGMGDCLPECPTGAITFEEREAAAYNEQAVAAHKKERKTQTNGCPGTTIREMQPSAFCEQTPHEVKPVCGLQNWPVQIRLAPPKAPYYSGAKLLIAADCTAYAYALFHTEFMKNRITLIGCPKLDAIEYSEKLTEIIRQNDIRSVTVIRMEVPCCGGLELAAKKALQASGKFIPWQVVTISIDGRILD